MDEGPKAVIAFWTRGNDNPMPHLVKRIEISSAKGNTKDFLGYRNADLIHSYGVAIDQKPLIDRDDSPREAIGFGSKNGKRSLTSRGNSVGEPRWETPDDWGNLESAGFQDIRLRALGMGCR